MQRRPTTAASLIPHALTFLRVPLAILFFTTFSAQDPRRVLSSAVLLALAWISDYLDGMLARRLGTAGAFGKWSDPLCDATFFLAVFAALYRDGLIPLLLVLLFTARESLQYGLIRPLSVRRGIDPGARLAGKIKTGLQNAGTAAVLALAYLHASGSTGADALRIASTAVFGVLVTVSLGSLYWYIVPLIATTSDRRLIASIVATVTAHLAINATVAALLPLLLDASPAPPLFLAALVAYHALIAGFLLVRRRDLEAGPAEPTSVLNLPCHLTLVRLSTAPLFAMLIVTLRGPAAAPIVIGSLSLVFLTDLADGRLARAHGQTTLMGRYLDPVADYVLLFATMIAAALSGAAASWYLPVFAARFALFPLGMGLLGIKRGRIEPESTFLGKVAVFAAMATLAFQLCGAFRVPALGEPLLVSIVEIATALVLGVSLIEKAIYLARKLRAP